MPLCFPAEEMRYGANLETLARNLWALDEDGEYKLEATTNRNPRCSQEPWSPRRS